MKIKVLIIRDHHITKWNGYDTMIGFNERGEVTAISGEKTRRLQYRGS